MEKSHFSIKNRINFFNFSFFEISRQPFDFRTPIGYLIAFLVEFVPNFYLLQFASCHSSFLVGSCLIIMEIVKDVNNEYRSIRSAKKTEIKAKMSKFVQFHANAMQLSSEITQIIGSIGEKFTILLLFFVTDWPMT